MLACLGQLPRTRRVHDFEALALAVDCANLQSMTIAPFSVAALIDGMHCAVVSPQGGTDAMSELSTCEVVGVICAVSWAGAGLIWAVASESRALCCHPVTLVALEQQCPALLPPALHLRSQPERIDLKHSSKACAAFGLTLMWEMQDLKWHGNLLPYFFVALTYLCFASQMQGLHGSSEMYSPLVTTKRLC